MGHPVSDSYDYGTCDICETPMHAQSITQDFWIRGELLSSRMSRQESVPNVGPRWSTRQSVVVSPRSWAMRNVLPLRRAWPFQSSTWKREPIQ